MAQRRFIQCDVFTDTPTRGNGLAVVVDGDGLTDGQMQAFAAWTNLAETTFLTTPPPGADYGIRIFTPAREMPFAGHPTLGSCAAWLASGGQPIDGRRIRQSGQIGIVEIDQTGPVPAFVAPPTRIEATEAAVEADLVATLGITPDRVLRSAALNNGPQWQVLELGSAADVLALDATRITYPDHIGIGVIGGYASGRHAYETRMLTSSSGMAEDPITGSLNAAIGHWLNAQGRIAGAFTIGQGQRIGRDGTVHVRPSGNDILIGGATQILITGTVTL